MIRLGLGLVHAFARLAVILSALAFEGGETVRATAWASVAGAIFVGARVAGGFFRARREIELSQTLLRRVLHGDLFANPLRGKQDVVIAGLYDEARVEVQVMPAMGADVLLVAFVIVFALSRGEEVRLLAFLLGLALGVAVVLVLRRSAQRSSVRAWEAREAHLRGVVDGLEGAAEIVSGCAEARYERRLVRTMRNARHASWIVGFESVIIGRLPILGGMGLALLAVYVITGAAAPARTADWALLGAMLAPFAGLAASVATLLETRGAVAALRALLNQPVRADGQTVPENAGAISLDSVDVRYGDIDALRGVSLELGRGLSVLSGANGSGKSTVLRLLAGLVVPTSGRLTVGGVASDTVSWDAVRKCTAILVQRPYIPVGATVRDYMTFLFDTPDDTCRAALERASAWSVLCAKSSNAPLSTAMEDLSAGERQRVAIARVLARDADLYLLDEPDANLDRAGFERLCEILEELAARATVIVAAHSPGLIGLADHVVELDCGRVVPNASERAPQASATQGA